VQHTIDPAAAAVVTWINLRRVILLKLPISHPKRAANKKPLSLRNSKRQKVLAGDKGDFGFWILDFRFWILDFES
jgi:hypothetical protein